MSIPLANTKKNYIGSLSPEYPLLGLLSGGPAHGYQLHQQLRVELGQIWHISLSQTYNILNRLEKAGHIKGYLQEQSKRPARRRFSMTSSGQKRFFDWLQAPSGLSVKAIRIEFTTRLYFASRQDPDLAFQMIADQILETHTGLKALSDTLDEVPPDQIYNRLSLELRIRHLESTLDWLNDCEKALNFSTLQV